MPVAFAGRPAKIKTFQRTRTVLEAPLSELEGTKAQMTANPADQWFMNILVKRPFQIGTTSPWGYPYGTSVGIQVRAIFYVELSDRKRYFTEDNQTETYEWETDITNNGAE